MSRPPTYSQGLPRTIDRRAALERLEEISEEITELTDRRCALWTDAARGPTTATEIRELNHRLERLWAMYRWLRSAALSGSHADIRVRARREEELERELRRRSAL